MAMATSMMMVTLAIAMMSLAVVAAVVAVAAAAVSAVYRQWRWPAPVGRVPRQVC
jgi:hypothetical protein